MIERNPLPYQTDKRGYFRVVEGRKFRPLEETKKGKVIYMTPKIYKRRGDNREMVLHHNNWDEDYISGRETDKEKERKPYPHYRKGSRGPNDD